MPAEERRYDSAVDALIHRREMLEAELDKLVLAVRRRERLIRDVDATLLLLAPTIDIKSLSHREQLAPEMHIFEPGELRRMAIGILRKEYCRLSTVELLNLMLRRKGGCLPDQDKRRTLMKALHAVLTDLCRRGFLMRSGKTKHRGPGSTASTMWEWALRRPTGWCPPPG
ncbi:MAG TPA: hypothetical protein VED40_23170 [Azospirillaceae bacterium]|nr:hypothetical protein [Azospirillaceae bacterium]